MARISGVDIPREKRLEIALTYIFGVGRSTALKMWTSSAKSKLVATKVSAIVKVCLYMVSAHTPMRAHVKVLRKQSPIRKRQRGSNG